MSFDPNASPFNALPPVVVALAAAIAVPELIFQLAGSGLLAGVGAGSDLRLLAIRNFGFFGDVFGWMIQNQTVTVDSLTRFVTYPFVHGSFVQMIFVAVFTLALGKMVGEVFSAISVLMIFFGSAIVGALVFGLIFRSESLLVGGFPAAYGLIGGYTFILWTGYRAMGGNQYQAFQLIGLLMAIQLVFGLLFGTNNDWVADIAGFVTGFALSVLVSPGGFNRLLQQIRSR
ncbi:rhomboid family intramembrane serine protease [Actibacterium sp. 188UL27-1]|uniref:rhomboid family intramembrane serine protease n=1 Tax=Actibacterium sp. 188UL27-1 TaxID=2786961 RepID=UPI001958DBC0|nr:rhomboid family intramembrane serine protease [Actibacterium sp. 188UL27-1]MBM7068129.1 rhomboid family intramembrane serine protease [Actibacterium sp. 188UL27-1]